ncbi:cation:proton antiporter [Fortiea sp. LEGE XX443]|uniref:cation:proton antiporter domain-containing protein n=1 Tax=Fortiea sp. LEGE XX443 TaxID=1828611 RepID=UPI001882201B|nr:cation:proton antiporter [Fortiea sp. LEGE XX443]MBE9004745.1 cation:proton antiporter [Fortiea sp. LEGE XX443]
MEPVLQVLAQEPVIPLAILLVVILVVPILFERLRLPGLVGLVFSGVVLGPSGWNLFPADLPIIDLLSDIGLVYLMFLVGLEQDFGKLHQNQKRSLGFAGFTFLIPFLTGILVGRIFGFAWNTSILMGCLFASYTLLAYPIMSRLGVVNNQAVSATIGATIFTDISVLLVLAVCVISLQVDVFSLSNLLILLGRLIVYSTIIVVGFDWAGQEFFRCSRDDEGNKILFVLLSVFLAVISAQFIGIEKIVGAFLAGLAINGVIGESPVKEKVVFIGSVLFIPIFFVDLGLLIDLPAWGRSITTLKLMLLVVFGVIVSKFLAALLAKFFYRYNWQEMLTMWSVSLPQVSTTLAATFVGYRAGLLSIEVLHSVVVLMLITSTLGPLLTSRLAVALTPPIPEPVIINLLEQKTAENRSNFTIVVPIYNPQSQHYLIEMAALLARRENSKIIPLTIAKIAARMDAAHLEASLQRSERLLAKATDQSLSLGIEAIPLLRIDDAFAPGISRAAREQKASLIVMGWGKRTDLRSRLFGNVIDAVLWTSHCPVAVTRLVESPHKIQRILVPLENLTSPALLIQFAQMLAEANQAQVTVLNVCDRRISSSKIAARRSHLSLLVSQLAQVNPPDIQIITHENVAQAILQAARLYDLVVLPFIRNYTIPGDLTMSDVTTQVARQLTCSIVMLKEVKRTQISTIPKSVTNTTSTV